MIGAVNRVRGAFSVLLLACLLILAGCHGDSTDESAAGHNSYTTSFFGTTLGYSVSGSISGVPTKTVQINGVDVVSPVPVTVRNRIRDAKGAIVKDDRLILRSNTAFVFPTPVRNGFSYEISVHDEPADLACSVANGSGVMAGANIANVSISCSNVPTYSVSGTVSGLSAGTVVLQNNSVILKDSDGEPIEWGNGSSFSVQVGDTKSFSISVYNKPANHSCTVTNGSGTVNGGPPTSSVSIVCAADAWTHPANLADPTMNISPNGQDAITPDVAMDDSGNAIAVWEQFDGADTQIYMSDYNLTTPTTWTPSPAAITLADNISTAGSYAHAPKVAMGRNPNGGGPGVPTDDAVIVWLQCVGGTAGTCRENPRTGTLRVFMMEYRAGVWSAPAMISPAPFATGRDAEDVKVVMDDNGNAIIIWRQPDGVGQPQLFMSEYRAGAWTHPADNNAIFSTAGNEVRFPPDVAMGRNPGTASDDAVVVWRQYSGGGDGGFRVYMREYRSGAWSAAPVLATDALGVWNGSGTPASGGVTGPDVEMDDMGNTIIVWDQPQLEPQPHPYFPGASEVEILQIFRSDFGITAAGWTHPVSFTDNISPDGMNALNPKVAMDDNGNAVITWLQSDPTGDLQLFMSEYRAATWANPASLSDNVTPDGTGVTTHNVAMDNNGNTIVAWRQFDEETFRVYKSEYRAGAWAHPVSLADGISPTVPDANDCNARDPDVTNCFLAAVSTGPVVAMDNSAAPGDALILWSQSDHKVSTTPIYQQIFMSEHR